METKPEKEKICFIYFLGCSEYSELQLERVLIVQKRKKKKTTLDKKIYI